MSDVAFVEGQVAQPAGPRPGEASSDGAAPPPSGRQRAWSRTWPYVVVIVVALAGSTLHVSRYTELSPFDESRHVDYIARLYEDGHFVAQGDKLGETAMRLEACRGVDVVGFDEPRCDARTLEPEDFRDEGFNNAVNNPPVYYAITGAVAYAVEATGLSGSILDPARIMSGVWLALGLALALYAGELLGVRRVPLVAAAVVFALAPEPLFMGGTVNADAASVFAGALVLVVALLWERRRLGIGWLLVAGALAASFKMTNLIGVGIVALWLATRTYRRSSGRSDDDELGEGRSVREYLHALGLVVVGAVGITLLWLGIAGASATIDALEIPSNAVFHEPGFPFRALVDRPNVFSLFPPVDGYLAPVLDTTMIRTVAFAASLLAMAAMVVAVLRFDARDRVGSLAAVAAVVLLVAGPGFITATWTVNRVIFEPVGRYGLSAIPVIVIAVAAAVRGRVGTFVLWGFALLSAGTVLGTLAVG